MHVRKYPHPRPGIQSPTCHIFRSLVSAVCEIVFNHYRPRYNLTIAKRIFAIAQRLKESDWASRYVLPTTCQLLSCCMSPAAGPSNQRN